MAHQAQSSSSSNNAITPDTLITIKLSVNNVAKRLKLPMRDLGINVLPEKLRSILDIQPDQHITLERYSDSASGYITLDENNPQVFKTLIRAAKAKLKLRLKVTVTPPTASEVTAEKETVEVEPAVVAAMAPPANVSRDSTALDQRSMGSGIFQFREARASQQSLGSAETLLPEIFSLTQPCAVPCAPSQPELAFRSRAPSDTTGKFSHAWSVYCNECDKSMSDAHYHCSICDGGDYDLCESCVAGGKLCPGEGHWLIKRFIKDGKVIHSTTERISPRPRVEPTEMASNSVLPGWTVDDKLKSMANFIESVKRTCNNCIVVLPEHEFVTCAVCDDFDLCLRCHAGDKHGHHPAHAFSPATDKTVLSLAAQTKLAAGRNVRHNAICDGCEQKIYGVRHKCLNCPDWDYCSKCVQNAGSTHRHHRFAALYEPISDLRPNVVRHYGIYCDGPLCNNKADQSYIQGVRYKCAVCHDKDFCAACEALPGNPHNRTHPLIKLKTPVRNVKVSSENTDVNGNVHMLGDRRSASASTQFSAVPVEALPIRPANAATQVHTVADIKPTEVKKEEPNPIEVKGLGEKMLASEVSTADALNAHFVRDSVPDGMTVDAGTRFAQVWTMRNPGPVAWPAGCSVRYVGGDNMLNVDNEHPASVTAIADATESNVVGRPVNVGEEVAFKVVLKAPLREGKSISYWRLKAPDGTPFGHRLWCDVDVQKSALASRLMSFIPPAKDLTTMPSGYDHTSLANRLERMRVLQSKNLSHLPREMLKDMESLLSSKAVENMTEAERCAAFHQRINDIKREVQKSRSEKKELQEKVAVFNRSLEEKKADEGEKVRKIIEEVSKDLEPEDNKEVENLEGSQMVFPKLEKESPASSTYQSIHSSSDSPKAAYVEDEDGEIEQTATPAPAPLAVFSSPTVAENEDSDETDEDIEVLSAHGDETEDDGFMTDEEYDILDASDQETVASMR